MIASSILFPLAEIPNIETYADSFTSEQMLPFIPSLLLGPVFVILVFSITSTTSQKNKRLNYLSVFFGLTCSIILVIHYSIQLTIVRQGLLHHDLIGLWQLVAPNMHSYFWVLASVGYGFMGLALLCIVPLFDKESERILRGLIVGNGVIGLGFLLGNALGAFIVDILASFSWGILFPITAIMLARKFSRQIPETISVTRLKMKR